MNDEFTVGATGYAGCCMHDSGISAEDVGYHDDDAVRSMRSKRELEVATDACVVGTITGVTLRCVGSEGGVHIMRLVLRDYSRGRHLIRGAFRGER